MRGISGYSAGNAVKFNPLTAHDALSDFGRMLSVGAIRFEDIGFALAKKVGGFTPEYRAHGSCLDWLEKSLGHPGVPCTWQLPWLAREKPWHPGVPCTWQLPWLAREEPWSPRSAVHMAAALAG